MATVLEVSPASGWDGLGPQGLVPSLPHPAGWGTCSRPEQPQTPAHLRGVMATEQNRTPGGRGQGTAAAAGRCDHCGSTRTLSCACCGHLQAAFSHLSHITYCPPSLVVLNFSPCPRCERRGRSPALSMCLSLQPTARPQDFQINN